MNLFRGDTSSLTQPQLDRIQLSVTPRLRDIVIAGNDCEDEGKISKFVDCVWVCLLLRFFISFGQLSTFELFRKNATQQRMVKDLAEGLGTGARDFVDAYD